MKTKQTLNIHQAQRQRQAFSGSFSQFLAWLGKSQSEVTAELRQKVQNNPFLHTVSDDLLDRAWQAECP